MDTHHAPEFTLMAALAAVGIALVYISLSSLVNEPNRQRLSAIIVAGAGSAYLSGGLGLWEFGFCSLMTFVAYKGLSSYAYLDIGWLLHTSWDVVHHLYANPIVPFEASSSAGCAVCDTILSVWFFAGAPNILSWLLPGQTSQVKANAGLGKSEQAEV